MSHGFPRWIRRDTESDVLQRSVAALWAQVRDCAPLSLPKARQDAMRALPDGALGASCSVDSSATSVCGRRNRR